MGSSSSHPHREMYFFWFPRLFPLLALQQFRVLGLSGSSAVSVFWLSHTVAVLKFSNLGIGYTKSSLTAMLNSEPAGSMVLCYLLIQRQLKHKTESVFARYESKMCVVSLLTEAHDH